MMNKLIAPFLFLLALLPGCFDDPEPIPQTINTYEYYYNLLIEPYDVQWEIDDAIILSDHSYGTSTFAVEVLDQPEQEVLFRTRSSDSGLQLDSLSIFLRENGAYILAILGSEEEPQLLCEPIDTHFPSTGMSKIRFMHAAPDMGPVDIYIGGELPENRVVSGQDYASLTENLEATEEGLWNAIVITPASSLPSDSTILSFTANSVFHHGYSYLCIIGHSQNDIESSYQLQVTDQPIY
jgi:hypothetical protein